MGFGHNVGGRMVPGSEAGTQAAQTRDRMVYAQDQASRNRGTSGGGGGGGGSGCLIFMVAVIGPAIAWGAVAVGSRVIGVI
ncbi:MAG: hypothetical protein ACF8SC_02380 [Phycisphaerales bacterium JB037]